MLNEKVFSNDLSIRRFINEPLGKNVNKLSKRTYKTRLYEFHRSVINGTHFIPGLTNEEDIEKFTEQGLSTSKATTNAKGEVVMTHIIGNRVVVSKTTDSTDGHLSSSVSAVSVATSSALSKTFNIITTDEVNKYIQEMTNGDESLRTTIEVNVYCCTAINYKQGRVSLKNMLTKYEKYENAVDLIKNPKNYGLKKMNLVEYQGREMLFESNVLKTCLETIKMHMSKLKDDDLKATPWELLFPFLFKNEQNINEILLPKINKLYNSTIKFKSSEDWLKAKLVRKAFNNDLYINDDDDDDDDDVPSLEDKTFVVNEVIDKELMPSFYRAITYSVDFSNTIDENIIQNSFKNFIEAYEQRTSKSVNLEQELSIKDALKNSVPNDFDNITDYPLIHQAIQITYISRLFELINDLSKEYPMKVRHEYDENFELGETTNDKKAILFKFISDIHGEGNFEAKQMKEILKNGISERVEKINKVLDIMQKCLIFKQNQHHYDNIKAFINSKIQPLSTCIDNLPESHINFDVKYVAEKLLTNESGFKVSDDSKMSSILNFIYTYVIKPGLKAIEKKNEQCKMNNRTYIHDFIDGLTKITKPMRDSLYDVICDEMATIDDDKDYNLYDKFSDSDRKYFNHVFITAELNILNDAIYKDMMKTFDFSEFLKNESIKYLCNMLDINMLHMKIDNFYSLYLEALNSKNEFFKDNNLYALNEKIRQQMQETIELPYEHDDKTNKDVLVVSDYDTIRFIFQILSIKTLLFKVLHNMINNVRNEQLVYQLFCKPNLREPTSIIDMVKNFNLNSKFTTMFYNALYSNSQVSDRSYELDQIYNKIDGITRRELFKGDDVFIDEDGFEVYLPFQQFTNPIFDHVNQRKNDILNYKTELNDESLTYGYRKQTMGNNEQEYFKQKIEKLKEDIKKLESDEVYNMITENEQIYDYIHHHLYAYKHDDDNELTNNDDLLNMVIQINDKNSFKLNEIFEYKRNDIGKSKIVLKSSKLDKQLKLNELMLRYSVNDNYIVPIEDKFGNWFEASCNKNKWSISDHPLQLSDDVKRYNEFDFAKLSNKPYLIDTFEDEYATLNKSRNQMYRFLICVPNNGACNIINDKYKNRRIIGTSDFRFTANKGDYPKFFLPIFPFKNDELHHFYAIDNKKIDIVRKNVSNNTFGSLNEKFGDEFKNEITRLIYDNPAIINGMTYGNSGTLLSIIICLCNLIQITERFLTITIDWTPMFVSDISELHLNKYGKLEEIDDLLKNTQNYYKKAGVEHFSTLFDDQNYKNVVYLGLHVLPLVISYCLNGESNCVSNIQNLFISSNNHHYLKGIQKKFIFDYERFSNRFKEIIIERNDKIDINLSKLPLIIEEVNNGTISNVEYINFEESSTKKIKSTSIKSFSLKKVVENITYLFISLCLSLIMSNNGRINYKIRNNGYYINTEVIRDSLINNNQLRTLFDSSIATYVCYYYELAYYREHPHSNHYIKKGSSLIPLLKHESIQDCKMDILAKCINIKDVSLSSIRAVNGLTSRFFNDIELLIANLSHS